MSADGVDLNPRMASIEYDLIAATAAAASEDISLAPTPRTAASPPERFRADSCVTAAAAVVVITLELYYTSDSSVC